MKRTREIDVRPGFQGKRARTARRNHRSLYGKPATSNRSGNTRKSSPLSDRSHFRRFDVNMGFSDNLILETGVYG